MLLSINSRLEMFRDRMMGVDRLQRYALQFRMTLQELQAVFERRDLYVGCGSDPSLSTAGVSDFVK